jgi:UDP-3-O-[3-hydroxymyristoyl] glucosamine N-acyltransferase
MEFSVEQIAGILSGEIVGDGSAKVSGLSKIEEGYQGTLTFLANPKYEEYLYSTKASVVIVNKTFAPAKEIPSTCTLIKVEDAYACFAKLLDAYNQFKLKQPVIEQPSFIDSSAVVGEDPYVGAFAYVGANAKIGNNVRIYPQVYVGDNVVIGNNTILFPGVKIYADCTIGEHCILHAGVVIGSDGFGFAPDEHNVYSKVPQIGNVVIEDNVEIGANTTIDRSTLGSTFIRKGVKLDNLIHLAHNVEVGENTAIAAQAGVAGSTKIGKNTMIGGQVGISGHIKIADGTKIVAQSGIPNSIKKEGETIMGSPGIVMDEFKKAYFGFRKLPYILSKLRELEEKLDKKEKNI